MQCTQRVNGNFENCFDTVGYQFKQEAYVPFVFDAVNVMARALHSYVQVSRMLECIVQTGLARLTVRPRSGKNATCRKWGSRVIACSSSIATCHLFVSRPVCMLNSNRRANNPGILANQPPLIDANGDGIGIYSIFQLDSNGSYVKVGRWLAGNDLQLNLGHIRRRLQVSAI